MLRDDLKTVRGILAKKREVGENLRETAAWCHPGVWYVEGPYARHKDTELPAVLRDSIRGIRTRQVSRELVERAAPPWLVNVPDMHSDGGPEPRCSIAYLSSGGDWKLFDFENQMIWTRVRNVERLERDRANYQRFSTFFNIPQWRTVELEDGLWRSETYISDSTLVQCAPDARASLYAVLLEQYRLFARSESRAADPGLTHAAFETIGECAPDSLPARIARKYRPQMEQLGSNVRLLPSHGDLSGQNIFVCAGQPWVIDWDDAGNLQPMFSDVLYLSVREAELGRPDILEAFLAGVFDPQFGRMFAQCDLSARPCDNLLLLVHSYIHHFHALRRAERRDATRDNVESLWARLETYCAAHI